ncbi:28S ribosomal protein S15, mitochondrial [Trichinella pseudospiralis]|uniref:28S ribosomal protein S15, mitochondrial n=1 Tax=Trichinella pseudospiralis TaxID=6337 RepID=A0A0V1G2G1_TRIPS|nr:28S ribosomal protein S15, mitochondrial [Trichinella pseudospiralis]
MSCSPGTDTKQADPAYYENLALSVPLAQGYIEGCVIFEIFPDSTDWLPHVDIKQPKSEYELVKALETAPVSVKKLLNCSKNYCSIEFGRRKDLTFQWKRSLMNEVRQNELDTSLLEVRIVKHTAVIRHWRQLLSEIKSHLTSFIHEGKWHAFPKGKLKHFIFPGQWPSSL